MSSVHITTTLLELNKTTKGHAEALEKVINLHTGVWQKFARRGKSGLTIRCTECGFAFPCPTINLIEVAFRDTPIVVKP